MKNLDDELGGIDDLLADLLPSEPSDPTPDLLAELLGADAKLDGPASGAPLLGAECIRLAMAGEIEAASEGLKALGRLAAEREASEPKIAAEARRCEALALLELGRFAEARAAVDAATQLADTAEDAPTQLAVGLAAARVVTFYGAPREASVLAEGVLRQAKSLGNAIAEVEAEALAGAAYVLMGEVSRGRRLIERRRAQASETGQLDTEKLATYLAGLAALAAGDWLLARKFAKQLGLEPGPSLTLSLPALLDAEACLVGIKKVGDPVGGLTLSEAVELLDEASARMKKVLHVCSGLPALATQARRITGSIAAERNDTKAIPLLEQALVEARSSGGPLEIARTLIALGTHSPRLDRRLQSGKRELLPLLREAETIAAAASARTLHEQARALVDAAESAAQERRISAGPARNERRELESLLEVGRAVSSILELDPLLERIMDEIIALLDAERGFVMLYDQPQPLQDAAPAGPAKDQLSAELKVRVARNIDRAQLSSAELSVSFSVIAEVERTRQPIVVSDALEDPRFWKQESVLALKLHSVLCFPLKTTRSFLGVIWVDSRSEASLFQARDLDLILPFVAQAAVAIENAFAYERIRELYQDAVSISRAREKVINHLSHELKTPLAVIDATLSIFSRKLDHEPALDRALERARRNFQRLNTIQTTIADIYQSKGLTALPEQLEHVSVAELFETVVDAARRDSSHRELEILVDLPAGLEVQAPRRPLKTALASLLRNAMENTPDEGRIELAALPAADGTVMLEVRDYGVGITVDNQRHLFVGFYHTQDTDHYSSRRPYDFDAGGKGLDLLRVRAFADRYGWTVSFESERCRFIPQDSDACPGRISNCSHCKARVDCLTSGRSVFRIQLPTSSDEMEEEGEETHG